MSLKVLFLFILAIFPSVLLAPVFLAGGGTKICTLNNIGSIPKGNMVYPVYQKVCREVIPTLGDFTDDEQSGVLSDETNSSDDDDEAQKVHRAILTTVEKREKPKRKCQGRK